jgi:hypothetical protein
MPNILLDYLIKNISVINDSSQITTDYLFCHLKHFADFEYSFSVQKEDEIIEYYNGTILSAIEQFGVLMIENKNYGYIVKASKILGNNISIHKVKIITRDLFDCFYVITIIISEDKHWLMFESHNEENDYYDNPILLK